MASTQTRKPVRTLVIPNRPPIDKFIAAKRVLLDWREVVRFDVAFCNVNFPTPELAVRWDRGNEGSAVLVDIGDAKYHRGFQSAADMQRAESTSEGGATWNRLVDLANRNNRDGFLKKYRHSVAKMVREIPHVLSDDELSMRVVWNHGMHMVDSYFWPQNKRSWDSLFDDPKNAALARLWSGFNVIDQEVGDFTLPMYFRAMFLSGREESEILQRISWWLDNNKEVQKRHEATRTAKFHLKRFKVGGKPAALVHVGDYFEAGAFGYKWVGSGKLALAIVRNLRGQAFIQTSFRHKGADFSRLAQILQRAEPARWYHETRFSASPFLMNGSWQFTDTTPTSLDDESLITGCQRFVRWKQDVHKSS